MLCFVIAGTADGQHAATVLHWEGLPETLEDGKLYISQRYSTAVHKCCCGCGQEVVIPLTPTNWSLTYDGKSVSLDPSIGNWSLPCRAHYFIRKNRVIWAGEMLQYWIEKGREVDRERKEIYFEKINEVQSNPKPTTLIAMPKDLHETVRICTGSRLKPAVLAFDAFFGSQ